MLTPSDVAADVVTARQERDPGISADLWRLALAPPVTGRRLEDSAEGHPADATPHAILKDDLMRVEKVSQATALGMR